MLLEESRISGEVELEIAGEGILIRKVHRPSSGWDEAFAAIADEDDDVSRLICRRLRSEGMAMVIRFEVYLINLDAEVVKGPQKYSSCCHYFAGRDQQPHFNSADRSHLIN